MSDNKLLAESTIRRFMKLANVDSLTETFIDNLEERGMMRGRDSEPAPMKDDDDEVKKEEKEEDDLKKEEKHEDEVKKEEKEDKLDEEIEGLFEEEEDEDDMEGMDDMDDMDDMEGMDDMGGMDPEAEPGAADMSLTEEEAQVLIDLGKRLEEAMAAEAGAEPPMDDAPAMDDEPAIDDPADPAGADEPEEEEELMQEELVQEVLKRVTKRLVAAKLNRK